MNGMWYLFEICVNVFQGWLYCFFLNSRMTRKNNIGRSKHRMASVALIASVALFYSLYIWLDVPVSDHAAWAFTLAYSMAVFSERWYVKIAWNACLAVLMLGALNLSSTLLIQFTGASWDLIMQPSALRIVFVLACNAMALFSIYVVAKLKPRQTAVSWGALLVFILMNAALVIGLEMQYQLSWESVVFQQQMLTTMICIIFVSGCTVLLFELLSLKAEQVVALEVEVENTRIIKQYNDELQAMYRELMEHQHDMKHQFCILEEMISRGETAESRTYLNSLQDHVLPVRYNTGSIPVDAILSVKTMRMRSEGIAFEFEPYPLTELPIDVQDFCALLGNLLDNAVEAVSELDAGSGRRFVYLKLMRIRDMLYVTCQNGADVHRIKRNGDKIYSSKRRNRPGYGIESMKRIADRANGFFSFDTIDDTVKVEIVLPYSVTEE